MGRVIALSNTKTNDKRVAVAAGFRARLTVDVIFIHVFRDVYGHPEHAERGRPDYQRVDVDLRIDQSVGLKMLFFELKNEFHNDNSIILYRRSTHSDADRRSHVGRIRLQ